MNGNVFPKNESIEQAAIQAAAVEAADRLNKSFTFTSGAALYPTALDLEQMGGAAFGYSSGAAYLPSSMNLGSLAGEDENKGRKWLLLALAIGGGYWAWKKYGKK